MPWHVAHQHRLLSALPEFEFYYLIQHTRRWDDRARPLPNNVKWVTCFEEGKYDLAILHVDQQCLLPKLGKSILFREVYEQVKGKLPVIVINHGTPVYPEMFRQMCVKDGYNDTEEDAQKWAAEKMKKLLEGVDEMVVNSYEAQKMWGWGKAIIHGYEPNDWYVLRKEPRVVTFISPAGLGEKYYGRRLFRNTIDTLYQKYGIKLTWIGQSVFFRNWEEYTRTEAMLSGCCVVTTPYQDADKFIKDGVNGFLCKENPEDAAKKIADCIFNYQRSVKIGKEARKTAIKLFNIKRYRQEWLELISSILK